MDASLELQARLGRCPCRRLLVRSWRLIMARGAECPLVRRGFTGVCGAEGEEVHLAFCTFLCALALAQRRCLLVNPPLSDRLTADEVRMLTLIAASQNDSPSLLQAHLQWLAERPLRKTLEQATHELARALRSRGLCLSMPA